MDDKSPKKLILPICELQIDDCLSLQRDRLHGRWQYLFVESLITDLNVLEQNYRYKMMYSPDYRNQNPEQA